MLRCKFTSRFKIYVARNEDVNQGWVRLGGYSLPHRSTVKLSATATRKTIYCEVLSIDKNFINQLPENHAARSDLSEEKAVLFAAEWYRVRLGIEKNSDPIIEVTCANHILGKVRACLIILKSRDA